jgi:hypothetical protein
MFAGGSFIIDMEGLLMDLSTDMISGEVTMSDADTLLNGPTPAMISCAWGIIDVA